MVASHASASCLPHEALTDTRAPHVAAAASPNHAHHLEGDVVIET
jgi:hypothetical protein